MVIIFATWVVDFGAALRLLSDSFVEFELMEVSDFSALSSAVSV